MGGIATELQDFNDLRLAGLGVGEAMGNPGGQCGLAERQGECSRQGKAAGQAGMDLCGAWIGEQQATIGTDELKADLQAVQGAEEELIVVQGAALLALDEAENTEGKVGEREDGEHRDDAAQPERRGEQWRRKEQTEVLGSDEGGDADGGNPGSQDGAASIAQHGAENDMEAIEHADGVSQTPTGEEQDGERTDVSEDMTRKLAIDGSELGIERGREALLAKKKGEVVEDTADQRHSD